MSIGAGTVLTRGQARDSIEAGAQFLVTPAIRPDVASVAHEANVPPIMGALTPTEMLAAVDLGAEAAKVFPAGALGPGYLKDLRGPFPDMRLVPSGGVTPENAQAFSPAGAHVLSTGYPCPPALGEAGDLEAIAARARALIVAGER